VTLRILVLSFQGIFIVSPIELSVLGLPCICDWELLHGESHTHTKTVDDHASISVIKPTVACKEIPIPQTVESQKISLDFWNLSGDETHCGLMPVYIRKA
jgi:hypothetical protein